MEQSDSMELVASNVDYITATVLLDKLSDGCELERASVLAEKLLTRESERGNYVRRFATFAFRGFQCGEVAAARSGRGYLFKLSSDAAAENWKSVFELSTNVSRLDVAATMRHKGPWRDMTLIHQQEAQGYVNQTAPRMRLTRIDGGKHGNSLLVGSRKSDAFGRIYDKEAESKDERWQDCWRYEVEFKRDAAVRAAQLLYDNELDPLAAAGMAAGWFATKAISGLQSLKPRHVTRAGGKRTDVARTLDWFRGHCRGGATKVIQAGRLPELLGSLGLTADVLASAGYLRQTPTNPIEGD